MDSITQAILGASVAEAVAGKKLGRAATVIGVIGGTIPDLDIIFYPFLTELQKVSFHRGLSHSLLFCFIGAFLMAYILSKLKRTQKLKFSKLYVTIFLVLTTHIVLDAFTSYGTQVFLPFSDRRVSFDSIGIIDLVYSIPLIVGLLMTLFRIKKNAENAWLPNYLGLALSTIYLFSTPIIKSQVERTISKQMENKGIKIEKLLTVPVYAGSTKWYGVGIDNDTLYLGKYSLIDDKKIEFHSFPVNEHLLEDLDPYLVDRMKWFAKGFYTVTEEDGKIRFYNLQVDMQGVKELKGYSAPTGFYYEIILGIKGEYKLSSGLHTGGR